MNPTRIAFQGYPVPFASAKKFAIEAKMPWNLPGLSWTRERFPQSAISNHDGACACAVMHAELFVERTVDEVFQRDAQPRAFGDGLRHQHHEHLLLPIDPEGSTAGARPVHLAN